MKVLYFVLIVINFSSVVRCDNSSNNVVWFGNIFTSVMNNFSINSKIINSSKCMIDNEIFRDHLQNGTYWAVQMDDSTVKNLVGLFDGNMFQPGASGQCIRSKNSEFNIAGRYCLVQGKISPQFKTDPDFETGRFEQDFPPYNQLKSYWEGLRFKRDILWHNRTKFKWGVCIPDSCSSEDLFLSLSESLVSELREFQINLDLQVLQEDCYTLAEITNEKLSLGGRIWISVLCILITVLIIASTYDWFLRRDYISEKQRMFKVERIILPFSLLKNCDRLCKISPDEKFQCVYGMKALSMLILVFGHKGMVRFGNGLQNLAGLEEVFRDVFYSYATNGTIVVDTFLAIGGYLTTYQLLQLLNKRGGVNILLIYVERALRLLPTYLFVITFYMYILPSLGQGPRWREIALRESFRCQKNWWTNILFINNFVDPQNMCLLQSWYVTADYQMFLVAIPIVYFLWAHPKYKVPTLSTLFILSVALPSVVTYRNKYWAVFPLITDWFYDPPSVPYYVDFYIQSYYRAIPYTVGIVGAFISDHLTEIKYKFSATFKIVGFITFAISVTGIVFVYISYRFYVTPYQYNVMENVIYGAAHRLIWSIAMVLLVMVHYCNGVGIISEILSMKMLVPLSRLTYTTFLVHIGILLYSVSTDEQNCFLTVHKFMISYMGDYAFSILAAFLLSMLVESPVDIFAKRLKKFILKTPSKKGISKENPVTTSLPEIYMAKDGNVEYKMRL